MSDNAKITGIQAELEFTANKQSVANVGKEVGKEISKNVTEAVAATVPKGMVRKVSETYKESLQASFNMTKLKTRLNANSDRLRTRNYDHYVDWWTKALAKRDAAAKAKVTNNFNKLNEVKVGSFTSVRTDDYINNSLGIGQKGFYTQEMVNQMFQSPLRKIAESFEKVKEAIKGTLKPLKVFLGRIGRIAVYRAIRTALKSIANAFKEGTDNLYQWSKAQSSLASNKFAQAMDKIATASLQFKNTIATVIEPIIVSLSAWIDKLMPKIVALGEALAQFMAKLTGQGSYQKAIKQNIAYANSVQKILLGFDELNVLNGDSTGKNISTMFETVVLDNTMEKLIAAKMIKIGAIVGGATLGLGAILTLTGANIPVGLALMASGATLIGKSIQANWDALSNEMKTAIGAITAVVTAGALVIGAILAFSGTNIPLGLGLIATSIVGMVTLAKLDWGFLKEKISATWESIKAWFNEKVAPKLKLTFWQEKGRNIVNGIKQGMMSAWESLKTWFKNAWNNLFGNLSTKLTLNASNRLSGNVWMEANGGTVPTGDLFIAGESGAELVSHIGGRNTVYNEEQLGNSLAYANESVVNAINTLIGVVKSKSNNVQISANDIRKAVNTSNMRLGV